MKTTDPLALFEENQKLAGYFLWKHYPAFAQDEDIQQEALLGLWKACITYDPIKAEFSTWAGYAVRSQVLMYLRKDCRRLSTVSIEATIEGTEGLRLEDIVEEPVPSICIGFICLKDFLRGLPEEQLQLVRMRYQGYTQDQISAQVGMSQAHCSRILKRLLNEYKKGSV